ncbi:hypothetical protein NQ314_000019, partial [Rhamnusium bicolor]
KGDTVEGKGHSHAITMKLMEKLLNEGRILICDNFYTSLPLAQELLSKKTFVCGTLRSNRKGIPKEITSKRLKRGDIIALENNEGAKICKWVDKRPVMMLTTCKNHLCKIIETDTPPIITKTPGRINTLGTYECQARQVRKRCRECYRKISEKEGKKEADRNAKKVKTFCHDCKDKPTLCLECFNVIHSKQK